jgi:acyl carrier protein
MSLDTRVQALFRDVFDDDNLTVNDSTSQSNLEGWDSFHQVKLLISVEEEFGVKLSIEESIALVSVGKLKELLIAKGIAS